MMREASHHRLLLWLIGVFLVAVGTMLRRWTPANTAGLVALFVGSAAPVVMLAFSAIALLFPVLALAKSGSINT